MIDDWRTPAVKAYEEGDAELRRLKAPALREPDAMTTRLCGHKGDRRQCIAPRCNCPVFVAEAPVGSKAAQALAAGGERIRSWRERQGTGQDDERINLGIAGRWLSTQEDEMIERRSPS